MHASPDVTVVSLPASSHSPKNLAIVISTADTLKLIRDRNDAKNSNFIFFIFPPYLLNI